MPKKKRGAATKFDPDAVVAFLKKHPGSSSEQVATAMGTATLRPAKGQVTASGKGRGMRYAAG